MHIEYWDSFLEAVHCRSMAKASDTLQLSHPALSKQIRSLEAYYGVTLLQRSPHGVEPTEEGRLLAERIAPVLAELKAIRSALTNLRGVRKAALGTLPSLAAHYLPSIVARLEQQGIEIEVSVRQTSSELYELLQTEELDAAVLEAGPHHTSLWSRKLFDEPYYAVVHKKHPFSNQTIVMIEQLGEEPLILHPPSCNIRKSVTGWLAERGLQPNVKAEVNFGDYILGYVATGAGITVVPQIAAEHIGNPELVRLPIEDGARTRTISLAALKEETGRRLFRAFR